jgi:quercetin dioxygenase-like cupin family protein
METQRGRLPIYWQRQPPASPKVTERSRLEDSLLERRQGSTPKLAEALSHIDLYQIGVYVKEGKAIVVRSGENVVEEMEWGRLVWMVSGAQGSSTTMTVGRCYIAPGAANPRHYHPNCDEVLHVLQGLIEHSAGDETVRMMAGDTISIPANVVHNATNVGEEEAVMVISFSSADRKAIGE